MRDSDEIPTSVSSPVVPLYFRADISQVTLENVWRNYDKYRSLVDKPDEAGERKTAEGLSI